MIIIGIIASQAGELPKTVSPSVSVSYIGTNFITWNVRNREFDDVDISYSVEVNFNSKWLPQDSGSDFIMEGSAKDITVYGLSYGKTYRIEVYATASGKAKSDPVTSTVTIV